ncbi:hypothetical protein PMV_150 [Port-miou virus]|uniref:Uncharacterized protein n=1 Tax=Port-miou virus TaxID=1733873 RepID=A0A0N7G2D8_9VIRU|nr:hypothetical protein PMV_150 [Port-miou virus]
MGNSKSKNNIYGNMNIRRNYAGSPLLKQRICESQHGENIQESRLFWIDIDQRQHIPFVVLDSETKEDAELLIARILNCHGDRQIGSFIAKVEIEDWEDLKEEDFVRFKKTWRDDFFILCFPQVF